MPSILTNTGAMVALQSLKATNKGMNQIQSQISTGLRVADSKDNAATWAISQTMRSDVNGFKAIEDSLALGNSTVSVARAAAEQVTDLLGQIKTKIIAAQEDNVDRAKLQTDVEGLRGQISSVVGAAQFNGLNLVNNSVVGGSIDILASLDRGSDGTVTSSNISVSTANLLTTATAATVRPTAVLAGVTTGNQVVVNADGNDALVLIDAGVAADDAEYGVTFDAGALAAGNEIRVAVGDKIATYTVTQADLDATTPDDVIATGVRDAINKLGITGLVVQYDSATAGQITFGNDGTGAVARSVAIGVYSGTNGGLSGLSSMDVSTAAGAGSALTAIEGMLQSAIDAAASFGSAQKRIEAQSSFISKLTDALNTGIGAMVDADMEEASARLQALQVQQQLGIQSLSIANQAPQSVLSLFR